MGDLSFMDDPDLFDDGPDPNCKCEDCVAEREFIAVVSPLLNEVTS